MRLQEGNYFYSIFDDFSGCLPLTQFVEGFKMYRARLSLLLVSVVSVLLANLSIASTDIPRNTATTMVRLSDHVLPELSKATKLEPQTDESNQPITLTIVLKRDDQTGFERYLHETYDPRSKNFHHYLTQRQIANRFGPSRRDSNSVLHYLQDNGFRLVHGSKNRLTLTVRATTYHDAENAFAIRIGHYRTGQRHFYANARDPALPSQLASKVESISGLSSMAVGERVNIHDFDNTCTAAGIALGVIPEVGTVLSFWVSVECFVVDNFVDFFDALNATPGSGFHCRFCLEQAPGGGERTSPVSTAVNGTGQTVGLLEFDSYETSDVNDYLNLLNLVGATAAPIGNLSQVPVNGGVSPPGSDQDEVLLDIDTVMTYAPGAKVVVYDAPFNGAQGYTALFNAMIDGGVTVISNSWASCEDQVSLADVHGIDSVLQNAALAGISVFNGTGDTGSTCLDGAANTISVPADSPNATAVGGSSIQTGPGYTYGSETWWGADGTQNAAVSAPANFFQCQAINQA
jgi:kumamolisin